MPSSIPERIGRYTILERLAVGGMAQVYLGFEKGDTGLQRVVVVKQILPQLQTDESFVQMFVQEARLAARINHPNVVEIHELGQSDGQPFIAMEYVGGIALNQLNSALAEMDTIMPVGVAVGILLQACAGAHAAHELTDNAGQPAMLVHRDLTPHNLMISERGHIKVLDFGVAKATTNQEKTKTGLLKGKLPYMSPEQLWQAELDRRSDVFTLGVVLWELLLGRKLYARDSDIATVNAVLNEGLASLGSVRSDVPDAIQGAALQALSKKPEDRFDSADAFRRALGQAARDSQLDTSDDQIGEFVASILGDRLAQRRQEITNQVERSIATLATAPAIPPLSGSGAAPARRGKPGAFTGLLVGSVLTAAVAVVVLAALLWGDVLRPGHEVIDVVEGPIAGDTLEILLAPTLSAETLGSELEPLRSYLERVLRVPVQIPVAQTYGEAAERLIKGEVPFANLPPNLFVQASASSAQVQMVAVKIHAQSWGSDAIILASEKSGIETIEDTRGRSICYTDPKSTTSFILPRAALRAAGIDPDRELAQAHVSGNHVQLLRDLAAGKCAFAGTFLDNFMNARAKGVNTAQLKLIAKTGRTPHDGICAGPSATQEQIDKLRQALLSFDPQRDAGVPELGQMERLTGFGIVEDAKYDALREALAAEDAASRQ
jgi:phosphate/phosphite/phosphonate ABC transporter binding protein